MDAKQRCCLFAGLLLAVVVVVVVAAACYCFCYCFEPVVLESKLPVAASRSKTASFDVIVYCLLAILAAPYRHHSDVELTNNEVN